ncbi:MAG: hypothetical protein JWM11_2216, partial [Planctomycetaceae bacterium]|nr:hypothetical protein [Planctomycetaceae bacterium]
MNYGSKLTDNHSTSLILACAGFFLFLVLCNSQPVSAQEVDGLAVAAALENTLVNAISKAEYSVVSIARVKPGLTPR